MTPEEALLNPDMPRGLSLTHFGSRASEFAEMHNRLRRTVVGRRPRA
jgi:hypothetical protein